MRSIFNINPDSAGFFTSFLCAIHCSAVPVMISFGMVGTGSWLHNHLFDWVIIAIGIVIASYSLIGDYLKAHRNILPLLMAIAGFLCLLTGMVEHHGVMLVFSIVGGLTVASAHILNRRLGQTCSLKN